uniref:RAVE complex protein Rav1 C-terminal domain-containing protein n=1 Tax=Panagrolaimus superbus TaxID=310955 RepID=A0A914YLS6_9BILA
MCSPNFDRVQIIPGNETDHGEIVSAVTCCGDSGKIAAVYGLQIRIFEPSQGISTSKIVPYQWHEVHRINVKKRVSTVQWVLEGLRLLVMCSSELILYQHQLLSTAVKDNHSTVTFSINEEKNDSGWDILWKTDLAFEVKVVKFSSDGTLFATCGENDNLVKIWYQQDEPFVGNQAHFTYTYLQHPATVTGFEWRRTSRYMPRKCVQNAIITWCEDNTSRIWKQIPKSDSQLEALIEAVDVVSRTNERTLKKNKSFRIKKARRKLVTKISQLVQKDVSRVRSESSSQSSNLTRSATFADFNVPASTVDSLHFCLVSTIDADNDCFLVPSLDSGTPASRQPFVIHWLNNKELIFAMGAEKILTDTVLNEQFETATRASSKAKNSPESNHDENIDEPFEDQQSSSAPGTPLPEKTPSLPMSRSSTVQDLTVMKDMLDTKLEGLLREWNKCVDVVFSVYPVDGSLLTWTIEWLDDTWRQPTINFASRFPNAFPLTDAASLNLSLYTFNPYNPVYAEVAQRQSPEPNEHHERADRIITRRQIDVPKNTVHLLTSHVNGSLNLWDLTTEENCAFTHILNIIHKSRMCGHRFHISKVIAHPVLPLLLTASQSTTQPEKDNESELILWKVSPVSPLCKSGGVRELSRLTSVSPSAFDCLSWVPAILPSSTLGTICNSPSSCFIASNKGRLCVYQAVVDARGLLAELYSSKIIRKSMSSSDDEITENENIESKHDLTETFNVVSTQSTAKPGCILFLEDVDSSEHISNDMLMLHVFNEELTLKHSQSPDDHPEFQNSSVIDRSQSSTFVDNYFIVMVVKTETEDRLRMWSLTVSSQIPQPIKNYVDDEDVKNENSQNEKFYPSATPNPPSAAKLEIKSKMVYNERIILPENIRVTSCTVAAGHLPSASLYPACRAPYLLVISCTDDHVRFLRCSTKPGEEKLNYDWSYWKMISNDINSDLELDGEVYTVSCAHSGRFAAAYHSGAATLGHKVGASLTQNIEVAVFECESSGGVEWLQEDSFNLDKYVIETAGGKYLSNNAYEYHGEDDAALTEKICGLVRLDWVSAEDGSHILTVGIGHTIYLFSQVSRDVAQQNIVMMKETDTKARGRLRKASSLVGSIHMSNKFVRWMCVRTLELQSADGFPPLPTAMSWVRDGMLIVGLHSEMRIYNQWNLTTCDSKPSRLEKIESKPQTTIAITDVDEGRVGSPQASSKATINISRSHSVLEQLSKRSKHDTSSNNKMMKEIMNKVFSSINLNELNSKDDTMLKALSEEGLFEASRLANPMLPQYHPKQLIEMLNSGKTKRVKAILLHMIRTLKQRSVAGVNALQRAASVRRLASIDATSMDANDMQLQNQRSLQVLDDDNADYEEIGNIPPLPLFALLEADETVTGDEKAANINQNEEAYDTLFVAEKDEEDLDDLLTDGYDTMSRRSRSRQSSGSFDQPNAPTKVDVSFTARHCRILTELLTHMQLPGLSSVDQMHLLSIADTLSHFSSSTIDRLIQANAAFNTSNHATASEAGTSKGVESVDECGLRFLMAMKQHEYLLRCLPLKQRQQLRSKGLSTAHIIWALHSDSETELYNAIPCVQKSQESWDELRSYGLAWWLKDANALRNCVERMAKTAFQQNQDPMDAALYYLSLKKKNVLTHLFKTIHDQAKADFFRNDFTELKWKKAAEKNAFVLMGKQKFRQAAALFLLAGSLTDAIKQLLKLRDIQLAMVVIRLFESDPERQSGIINEILCNEVLGIHTDHLKRTSVNSPTEASFMSPTNSTHSNDAFERSMAYWLVKNYAKSASTLLEEANKTSFSVNGGFTGCSLSDIFNLYSYLRRHPLVTRQRLTDAGIQTGSTEKVFQLARELESRVTPSERRLFFRTASVHMASGCPLLALDVLLRLPKQLGDFLPDDGNIADALNEGRKLTNVSKSVQEPESVNNFDWSVPTNVIKDDELKLDWSDDEAEDEEEQKKEHEEKINHEEEPPVENHVENHVNGEVKPARSIDFIAQHLKFVAALRVFMEELATLASGFEVDGGQLRCELFRWLEKECIVLRDICDYQMDLVINVPDYHDDIISDLNDLRNITLNDLRLDQQGSYCRSPARRRLWLSAHQKLIRTFTSYCALHGAQNYRLTSVLMELLLLLLELQQDKTIWSQRDDSSPKVRPFPLLVGSLWNCRMFLSSPLHFIETQSTDLLLTIIEFTQPLGFDLSLPKVYELYNLCQGLSSCLYQSLTDIDNSWTSGNPEGSVSNMRRYNSFNAASEDMPVVSPPCRWPGVQSFIALLECEKDEDCPNLQQLIAECFVAISMSLFCYSFSLYDSRWLFRLMAHDINAKAFGTIFGGAGEQKVRPVPSRPPPPRPDQNSSSQGDSIRAKLHAKVFGISPQPDNRRREGSQSEQVISCWLPPKKHVVQFFAEKVELYGDESEYDYESDDAQSVESSDGEEDGHEKEPRPHDSPNSYAWHLMRLALALQQVHRMKQFIQLIGFDLNDLPSTSPRMCKILKVLESWIEQLNETLERYPGGCPANFLPNPYVDVDVSTHNVPLLRKYRLLIEAGNTPFEYDSKGVKAVKRLWSYLVRQENLSGHFIKFIFEKNGAKDIGKDSSVASGANSNTSKDSQTVVKIMHREQEAILAFATSNVKPSWIAVSNGREIQEISMDTLFEEQQNLADNRTSYLNNRVALDIALEKNAKDTLRDNDDYQVLLDGKIKTNTSFITPFILDRSRVSLKKVG